MSIVKDFPYNFIAHEDRLELEISLSGDIHNIDRVIESRNNIISRLHNRMRLNTNAVEIDYFILSCPKQIIDDYLQACDIAIKLSGRELSVKIPPIGIMPQWRWLELKSNFYSIDDLILRYVDLDAAIKRYLASGYDLCDKWLEERADICSQIALDKTWACDPLGLSAFCFETALKTIGWMAVAIQDLAFRLK